MESVSNEIERGRKLFNELVSNEQTLTQWKTVDPFIVLNNHGFETNPDSEIAPAIRKFLSELPLPSDGANAVFDQCWWCKTGTSVVIGGVFAISVTAIVAAVATAVAAAIASGGTAVPAEIAGGVVGAGVIAEAAVATTATICGISATVFWSCISNAIIYALGAGIIAFGEVFISTLIQYICEASNTCPK